MELLCALGWGLGNMSVLASGPAFFWVWVTNLLMDTAFLLPFWLEITQAPGRPLLPPRSRLGWCLYVFVWVFYTPSVPNHTIPACSQRTSPKPLQLLLRFHNPLANCTWSFFPWGCNVGGWVDGLLVAPTRPGPRGDWGFRGWLTTARVKESLETRGILQEWATSGSKQEETNRSQAGQRQDSYFGSARRCAQALAWCLEGFPVSPWEPLAHLPAKLSWEARAQL